MSFIVEATRRQQQETVPDEAASLAFERVRQRERRIRLAAGVLAATGLMLTVAIVIREFLPGTSPDSPRTATPNPVAVIPGTPVITSVEDVGSDTSWYQPIERPEAASDTSAVLPGAQDRMPADTVRREASMAAAGEIATTGRSSPRIPVTLQDAPDDAQRTLLALRYSSHLYTSTPAQRSLSVNGRRMREGEAIGEWVLAEITQQGAIWDDGNVMVDVPVLDLWQ
jgi:general secretion pathway protein B